ncbi:down syndrome cell adhesion molecule-like protein Dscam2 [Caerostris extrusa]|uniref:Down syndrome cell adhesion molecule-like protein Dscam2 n=1 Tax=Caerostris extrusa TaxID=172846 RepID=A0AAV4M676_CAEEX|nr:down syndrome cell adhesion molecule-like protein Dscam2 [Caerostris extrusa]
MCMIHLKIILAAIIKAEVEGSISEFRCATIFNLSISEQTIHPGNTVSLRCIATGNPSPRVTWYLDGTVIGRTSRISLGDYVTDHAHMVSFLNISETHMEDGGEYTCEVSNDVGSTSHSARLNVNGPAFVRSMPNVTAISSEDLMIRCPYGGYPIKAVPVV